MGYGIFEKRTREVVAILHRNSGIKIQKFYLTYVCLQLSYF